MAKLKGKARAKASRKKILKRRNAYFSKRKELLSLIRKWDDPILKQVCEDVSPDEDISYIVKKLKQVLNATKTGLGLSASQIGYAKRIFASMPKGSGEDISIIINSKLIEESEEKAAFREGCLSYPSFYIPVERSVEVTFQYEDEDRKSHTRKFKGMAARVVLHEHDHTYGICVVGEQYYKEDEVKENQSSYEVVESEDLKREKAEKAEKENEIISEDVT